MAKIAKSLDGTIAAVTETLNRTRELTVQHERNREQMAEMREQFGLTDEKIGNFMNGLSEEDKAKVAEEKENFARELQRDEEEALYRSSKEEGGPVKKSKGRQYF